MSPDEHDSSTSQDPGLDVLRALACGDVSLNDAREQLNNDAIDALGLLLAMVAQAKRASIAPVEDLLDAQIQNFSKSTPPDSAQRTVHQVPLMPVMLNGTMYDPADIKRFGWKRAPLYIVKRSPSCVR